MSRNTWTGDKRPTTAIQHVQFNASHNTFTQQTRLFRYFLKHITSELCIKIIHNNTGTVLSALPHVLHTIRFDLACTQCWWLRWIWAPTQDASRRHSSAIANAQLHLQDLPTVCTLPASIKARFIRNRKSETQTAFMSVRTVSLMSSRWPFSGPVFCLSIHMVSWNTIFYQQPGTNHSHTLTVFWSPQYYLASYQTLWLVLAWMFSSHAV